MPPCAESPCICQATEIARRSYTKVGTTGADGVTRAVVYVEGSVRPKESDVGRKRKLEARRVLQAHGLCRDEGHLGE
jgi:hypothetical protein